jgi:comEA protein
MQPRNPCDWRVPQSRDLAIWKKLIACVVVLLLFLPTSTTFAKKKPPPKPVNINLAAAAELQKVPGIGPSTAEKILEMRKSYGPFKSVGDLQAIRGIGKKRLDKMRKYLTVGTAAAPSKTAPAAKSTTSKKPQTTPSKP